MFSSLWDNCHASVCHLNFLNERGVSVDCLSGFKVNKSLVTSQQAFYVEKAHKVEITFVGKDANRITASVRIPYREFINEHRIGVVNSNGHYALFNIDLPEFECIPSLKMSERMNFSIGSQVAVLAYINGYSNLSLSTGIISSTYTNPEGTRFIQFDCQTAYGNSGAPLIDPNTKEVIGIVSRRSTPAAKAYRQLLDIIGTNIDELRNVGSVVKFGDVDPVQVLIANQNQLKHLANNIYKNSVTSTSQAVTLDRVISFFCENTCQKAGNEIAEREVDYIQG
jgi:S1-C subfamily serine protease